MEIAIESMDLFQNASELFWMTLGLAGSRCRTSSSNTSTTTITASTTSTSTSTTGAAAGRQAALGSVPLSAGTVRSRRGRRKEIRLSAVPPFGRFSLLP